jgi:hypothetical protein
MSRDLLSVNRLVSLTNSIARLDGIWCVSISYESSVIANPIFFANPIYLRLRFPLLILYYYPLSYHLTSHIQRADSNRPTPSYFCAECHIGHKLEVPRQADVWKRFYDHLTAPGMGTSDYLMRLGRRRRTASDEVFGEAFREVSTVPKNWRTRYQNKKVSMSFELLGMFS